MLGRREILGMLAVAGAAPLLASVPDLAVSAREPWDSFAKGPHFKAFVAAIRKLKAHADPASPNSWRFWADIHQNHCPHGRDYFLAWHRGYLWLFERKLRELSRVDTLRLPYWDYFATPQVPAEFLSGDAASNPLFETRKGSNVAAAIGYGPFDPAVTAFQRGTANAFEGKIEGTPHNNVHNLIGGHMATMQSPQDVLFWLHHANVDRIWSAWVAAGEGRAMPAADAAYWQGALGYGPGMSVPRTDCIACESLGYRYADLKLPKPRPSPPPPPPVRSEAPGAGPDRTNVAPPRRRPPGFQETGGISLGDAPVSVNVGLLMAISDDGAPPPPPAPVRSAPGGNRAPAARPAPPPPEEVVPEEGAPEEVVVVLNDVSMTRLGAEGGYFFRILLNLHDAGFADDESRLLGTIGPFQIAAAMHHSEDGKARIELPATELIQRLVREHGAPRHGTVSLTFARVNAERAPAGKVIDIGSYRIDGTFEVR